MKSIPVGTCFAIPLPNKKFGLGYVVCENDAVFVNITSLIFDSVKAINYVEGADIVLRDFLIDWASFRKREYYKYPNLILKRNKVILDVPEMVNPWIILGGGNAYNVLTNEQYRASEREKEQYPQFIIPHPDEAYVRICEALSFQL